METYDQDCCDVCQYHYVFALSVPPNTCAKFAELLLTDTSTEVLLVRRNPERRRSAAPAGTAPVLLPRLHLLSGQRRISDLHQKVVVQECHPGCYQADRSGQTRLRQGSRQQWNPPS